MIAARTIGALAASAALGCASAVSQLPDCDADVASHPLPSAACLASPEAGAFEEALESAVRRDAGPLLVRVELDGGASIEAVCVDRSAGRSEWGARARLARQTGALRALGPAPACLAGTRLELNRVAAREAEVDDLLEECRRELRLRLETDPKASLPSEIVRRDAGRAFRRCIDEAQRRRAELWVFRSFDRTPLVFVETEGSAPRRTALLDCTDAWTKDEIFDNRTGFARDVGATTRCMRELGWEPLEAQEGPDAEPGAAGR